MQTRTLLLLIFLLLIFSNIYPQKRSLLREKVDTCIKNYEKFSKFGWSDNQDTVSEFFSGFKSVFDKGNDVFILWDLSKSRTKTTDALFVKTQKLRVYEYIDTMNAVYKGRHPYLTYEKGKTRLNTRENSAKVYLTKYNHIKDSKGEKTIDVKSYKILINLNIYDKNALISGIMVDKRISFVRGVNFYFNYIPWYNISKKPFQTPQSDVNNGLVGNYNISGKTILNIGCDADLRISKDPPEKKYFFNIGISYTRVKYNITLYNYFFSYRTLLDAESENAFECSTNERSNNIEEKLTINSLSLPFSVKYFFKRLNSINIFFRMGFQVDYFFGNTFINYSLSRTGGGLMIRIKDKTQQFLHENNEMDYTQYGYFRNDLQEQNPILTFNSLNCSLLFGVGIEKVLLPNMSIGLEPNVIIGLTHLYKNFPSDSYKLYPSEKYKSVLYTFPSTKLFMAGIKICITYLI